MSNVEFPTLPGINALSDEDQLLCRRYALVLMDVVQIVSERNGATFGSALEAALLHRALPPPPKKIEQIILTAAFRIVTNKRLPGAADA